MIIFPAIDLLDGKCVRLKQGLYDQVTKYSDRPEEVARDFKAQGAKWIHIVDLNAAKTGVPTNHEIIGRVVAETGLRIQTGGGIRIIFDRKGLDDRGKVKGVHRATGLKPRCLDKLVSMGINVPDEYFRPE